MNKIIVFITCSMLCFSAFSCGDIEEENEKTAQKVSGEMLDSGILPEYETDEELVSGLIGSAEAIACEPYLQSAAFRSYFSDYYERYPDAYAAAPINVAAISKEGKGIYRVNLWYVPVVSDGKCRGIIGIDCRKGEPTMESYASTGFLCSGINTITETGSVVIFTLGGAFYGMYSDNTVVTLSDPTDSVYDGSFTFDEMDQGYNFVPQNWAETVAYKPESESELDVSSLEW